PVLTKSGSFLVTWSAIAIEQSLCDTVGVTSSRRSAWTNWVWVPVADTVWIGIDTPDEMLASLLLSTVTLGAEMIRTVPVSSSADSRRLMLRLPATEPSDRPSAPPSPEPTAAGRLTAKSDGAATPVRL